MIGKPPLWEIAGVETLTHKGIRVLFHSGEKDGLLCGGKELLAPSSTA